MNPLLGRQSAKEKSLQQSKRTNHTRSKSQTPNNMIKPSIATIVLSAALCSWTGAADTEEKVSLEKIPAAAAKALKEHAGDAKITNLSKEKDEGKTVYEATYTKKARVHDVTVNEAGKLLSDEEVVPVPSA